MGKSKKKAKAEKDGPVDRSPVVIPGNGDHCYSATILPASTAVLHGTEGRLGIAAEAFLTAQLSSSQLVAVALSSQQTEEEEALPGLVGSQKQHPDRVVLQKSFPENLWRHTGEESAASGDGGWDQQPGEFLLLATVWAAKVPKGKAAVSAGLLSSLGGTTAVGKRVLVYKLPAELKKSGASSIDLSGPAEEAQSPEVSGFEAGSSRVLKASDELPSPTEWLSRMLNKEKPRQLLELSAAWHLKNRLLLSGNPVALPILGKDCLFRACFQPGISPWTYARVGPDSKVSFVRIAQGLQEEAQRAVPEDAAERAAEVAAEEIGDGREGPAAQAAHRAASLGAEALLGDGLETLGGLQRQTAALRQLVCLPLKDPELFARYSIQPPRGVLLWGPPGTGKTRLASAIAASAGAAFFVINGPDIVSAYYGHSEQGLRGVFAAARAAAPAIIFIDELDALGAAREGGNASAGSPQVHSAATGASARAVTTLLTEMQQPSAGAVGVMVLAATNRPEALDAALRRPGRFDQELEIGVPSPADRADILRVCLKDVKHDLRDEDLHELAAAAHGFVGADLAALCQEAALACLRRAIFADFSCPLAVTPEDFKSAKTRVRPSAMREVALEVPNVSWADVGGLQDVKQRLREAVQWPQQHADALERLGAKAPAGVLLYGPPGCSKTLLARAVAAEAKLNFLAVKGPELFSKYVGDTERALAALFARARAAAPAIVFFDELDGLASSRGAGEAGGGEVGNRVVGQLLTEMDGLQRRSGVVVLAATNRPDRIDAALLRPGRFDRLLFVPPPDEAARAAIFEVHTRRTPLDADVDLERLAASTAGHTGADIGAVVREASLAALEEDLTACQVAARHFNAALKAVRGSAPSSGKELALFEAFGR